MIICPNLKNPDVAREFNELKLATSELAAYHIWSLNNGHAIDKAPNGALSKLFLDLLDLCGGNRTKAILAKAKVYGNGFINWFGDWTDVDNSETFIFYQGRRSEDIDDRKYNYWTIDEEDAKRNYGQFIRNRRINTKNFLKKHKVVGRHVNPDGTKYYDFAWTDEYKAINEEFKQKYGYKYGFDILDSSKEGLVKQKQFFEFVESKGYSGYREYMKETPENPYVVTFGNTNDAVSKVVDENGEPLVVYHGSNSYGFTTFDPLKSDDKKSLFFSDSRFIASTYVNFEPIRNAIVRKRLLDNNAIELIKKGDYTALQKLILDTLDYSLPIPIRDVKYDIRYDPNIDEKIGELRKIYNSNINEEEALGVRADIAKLEDTMWFSNNYRLRIRKIPSIKKDGQKYERIVLKIDDVWKKERDSSHFIEKGIVFEGTPEQLIEAIQTETKIYDLFLNIKNPLILSNQTGEFGASNNWDKIVYEGLIYKTREISKMAHKKGHDGVLFEKIIDHGGYKGDADLSPVTDASIVYDYFHEGEDSYTGSNIYFSNIYIAYDPNQVKSATDNNGEFSLENNDIHFAISEESNTRERTDEETSIVQLLIDYIKSIGIPVHNRQEMIQKLGYSLVSWYTASTENDNIQMMVVGEKGAKRLDSAEEATTRMDNLSVANEMEKAGKDALTIKMATGWERGVDGKWRYETNDIKYKSREITGRLIKASHNTDSVQEPVRCKLSDILSDSKNQPEDTIYNIISSNPILQELNLEFSSNKYINGADMMYNPRTNTIYIGNFFLGDLEAKNTWYATLFAKELTHELQHVLQTSEGFEFGTSVGGPVSILQYDKKLKQAREYVKKQIELKNTNNVDYEALLTELNSSDFDKKLKAISFVNYYRNAGEVEARTAANRRALSPEERRNSLFTDDMYKDVAKEDLIFLQERLEDIPFITPTGEIYGFVDNNGEIYLDETVISSEHPIHEFTHLWDKIIQQHNKKLWNRGVKLMKQIPLWKQIEESKHYGLKWKSTPGMTKSRLDNLIASEVHARLTGENGSLIIENIAKEKGSSNIVEKLKNWISEFWQSLKETFGQWSEQDLNDLSIEDFINMPIRDLIDFDKFKNLYSGEFNTSLQVKDQLKSLGEQLMKQC